MAIENLLAFLLAATIIELTPGPNMGYLALVSLGEGRRAGLMTVAGIALGLAAIGTASALGLAGIISNSPLAYETLRWGGIAFLLYLAFDAWRSVETETADHTSAAHFRRGLVTNLLNPKAALFFITAIPAFLPRREEDLSANLLLVAVYVAVATIIHGGIVLLAGSLAPYLTDPERSRILRRLLALLLAGVAIWFGWSTAQPV
ncbi:MAG: lysine transporter LysE [Rhizobiales bacterium]|nr:lysine transporter LysE [Hyphomicrobiales bacterium]MBA69312.1 lysine transporter LysE [Hyphomicrobiales bacterium]|tara:strand:+ start:975 stop:1586 length:612 start_codon:yes stop_codon:yes gene_type:complete